MLCVECGHLNDSFATICEKCRKPLPDRETPPPKLEGHLRELERACNNVKSRQISSGDFRNLLNRLENVFAKTIEDVQNMEMPIEYRDEFQAEIGTGIGGLKLYIEALHEMHSFLDTRQEHFLDRGLMMARNANDRVNEALQINFENYRTIQETAEEFLQTMPGV